MNQLYHNDCFDILPSIPDQSVDMVFCDLPYGKTACSWDTPLDLKVLWSHWKRVCRGCIILTGTQPFTSVLVISNMKDFRYEIILDKSKGSDPMLSKKKPMSSHENVLLFGKPVIYNPQMTEGKPYSSPRTGGNRTNSITGMNADKVGFVQKTADTSKRFPLTVQKFSIHCGSKLHPSQKPIGLLEFLIRSYTEEGMTVLDNCMGSGTTGAACMATGRNFIGIEKDLHYFHVAKRRLEM